MRMWLNFYVQFHTVRMAAALVCALTAVTVCVSPDSLQHHTDEYLTVSCPSKWTAFRQTRSKKTPEACGSWGVHREAGCREGPTLSSDSGLYWCQNQHNQTQRSPAANITISKEKVILESPLFPVKEGEQVTLRCFYKVKDSAKPTSNFNASFFLNDTLLGQFPGGQMVLSPVTRNDQGLYHCEHPTTDRSLQSLLFVELNDAVPSLAPPTSSPLPKEIPLFRLLCFLVLVLLYTFILAISISIYCKWTRARAEQKQQESERVSLRRIRDA